MMKGVTGSFRSLYQRLIRSESKTRHINDGLTDWQSGRERVVTTISLSQLSASCSFNCRSCVGTYLRSESY